MKKFEMPIINVAKFDVEDVLTTSGAPVETEGPSVDINTHEDYGNTICYGTQVDWGEPAGCLPYT